ncbi:hypothetical protein LX32DRAFT_47796 [Colletotrichum zoysiae]|uniref:Uncharacterized protein n=1 Tax=Colletotrichum zoysiae TaxID=1216348 RepID=A0AAD9HDA0_9PEZI|nr:hypothetical protein LX32DRAFT_47796 [Colletotrichum zoysiae]
MIPGRYCMQGAHHSSKPRLSAKCGSYVPHRFVYLAQDACCTRASGRLVQLSLSATGAGHRAGNRYVWHSIEFWPKTRQGRAAWKHGRISSTSRALTAGETTNSNPRDPVNDAQSAAVGVPLDAMGEEGLFFFLFLFCGIGGKAEEFPRWRCVAFSPA